MEFTKRSNLGALLAAVMVGLLSLCINQVFRVEPEDVDRFLERLAQIRKNMLNSRSIERSPLKLQDDLIQLEKALNEIFHRRVLGQKLDTRHVIHTVRVLTITAEALENHEFATPPQVKQGRMLAFSGLFLAAQMMPDEFSEQFRRMGDYILTTDSTAAQLEHVRLLTEFHQFKVGQMQDMRDVEVVQLLRDYSQRQTDESLAIRLYLLIAEEVWNQGRLTLARDILHLGVNSYRDHPDKQKLANRLIDLQIESTSPYRFP